MDRKTGQRGNVEGYELLGFFSVCFFCELYDAGKGAFCLLCKHLSTNVLENVGQCSVNKSSGDIPYC